jgi:hypothetical protein
MYFVQLFCVIYVMVFITFIILIAQAYTMTKYISVKNAAFIREKKYINM